jgi:hypothetical protein
MAEKEKIFNELKNKHNELIEKMVRRRNKFFIQYYGFI